ncbi:MAG: histidine phosphatase family protein [Renibacterium sp.]|nr:histidine phosphatase family protein [Renibacterium sp.]
MRRLLFWRHGRTEWNLAGRFQGQTDIGLDDVGREQARRSAALLAGLRPSAIVSSDLSRTRETAGYLAEQTGLVPTLDPRLRETFAGRWEGLTFTEIDQAFPDESAAWKSGTVHVRPGGGESRFEVGERVAAGTLAATAGVRPDGLLVVVTHGGAARSGLASLLGLPSEYWGAISGLANCHWSVLEEHDAPGGWRLTEHNAGSLPEPVVGQEG